MNQGPVREIFIRFEFDVFRPLGDVSDVLGDLFTFHNQPHTRIG